jgi:hypothetical protein
MIEPDRIRLAVSACQAQGTGLLHQWVQTTACHFYNGATPKQVQLICCDPEETIPHDRPLWYSVNFFEGILFDVILGRPQMCNIFGRCS